MVFKATFNSISVIL